MIVVAGSVVARQDTFAELQPLAASASTIDLYEATRCGCESGCMAALLIPILQCSMLVRSYAGAIERPK